MNATRGRLARRHGWPLAILAFALLAACAPAASSPAAPAAPISAAPRAAAPATAAPAAAPTAAPAASEPPKLARVVIGGLGGMIDRVTYIARDKGFYREQGIEIEYVPMTSMVQAAPILATGQMDVMSSSTSAGLWNAIVRDVPIKIVSDVTVLRAGQKSSLTVVVRPELAASMRDYADLRGKTVAIHQKAQINHVQLGRLLQLGGLTESDINLLEITFPEQLPAFRNQAIDAAIAVEPLTTTMEDLGLATRWRELGDFYAGQIVQFLFYSAPFIREQRDVGVRFLTAHLQAARFFDAAFKDGSNREEVISIMIDNGQIKDRTIYERIGPTYATELNGRISVDSLVDEQEFYLRNGMQTARLDPAQIIDTSFGEAAVRLIGRVEQ
jgi:NitT/TauT family transport system substrate-binding protein